MIAAGLRPRHYPDMPELKDYAITSDDLFSLKENPGKTLVIGGGYIAIECAGFIKGLGNDVTLINRSTFLRVFDQDMAEKITDELEEQGVQLHRHSKVKKVEKKGEREYSVELEVGKDK